MVGSVGTGRIGLQYIMVMVLVLAGVSAATWLFVVKRWPEEILGLFYGPDHVNPTHVLIANIAVGAAFALTWWRYLLVKSPWTKGAVVLAALAVWIATSQAALQ
jgi:hypothetical protein